jgi:hypothetical protein
MGVTKEYFKHNRNVPTQMALLDMVHNGKDTVYWECLLSISLSKSHHCELFGCKEEITFKFL